MALIAGLEDSAHDRWIIQLLSLIDFVATGVAACVVVKELLVIVSNSPDYVTLHNLHVVNIVEQAEPLRIDRLAKIYTCLLYTSDAADE